MGEFNALSVAVEMDWGAVVYWRWIKAVDILEAKILLTGAQAVPGVKCGRFGAEIIAHQKPFSVHWITHSNLDGFNNRAILIPQCSEPLIPFIVNGISITPTESSVE